MRPSPPRRRRSSNLADNVADRIVARLGALRIADGVGQVKGGKNTIHRSVDQPDRTIRFYLFYGHDEGQARGLGARLVEALGATKLAVAASAIKSDPALLADEAAAMSLFGGPRRYGSNRPARTSRRACGPCSTDRRRKAR